MKRLLIIQNYNANKGDSSVIHAMKQSLLRDGNDLTISVTSYDPDKARIEYGLESSEWLVSYRGIKLARSFSHKLLFAVKEGLWIIYLLCWLLAYRCGVRCYIPGFKRDTVRLYLEADVIVLPGGHFFTNFNGFATNLSHFLAMLFAFGLRKKSMIYAQTIGPFFGRFGQLTRMMTQFTMRHADLVTIREKDSLKECRGGNVHVTAETVFSLENDPFPGYRLPDLISLEECVKPVIGVTIHHIYFKHFFTRAEYVALMASIFDSILKTADVELLIIPMEDSCHHGGDRPIAGEMIAAMKGPRHIRILDGDHSPTVITAIISRMDLFIGTKTHSIVYGLKTAVPTISISYQQKSNEFMEMFGMLEYAIDLKDLELERFMTIFRKANDNRARIREDLGLGLDEVRRRANENNRLLMSLFEERL